MMVELRQIWRTTVNFVRTSKANFNYNRSFLVQVWKGKADLERFNNFPCAHVKADWVTM